MHSDDADDPLRDAAGDQRSPRSHAVGAANAFFCSHFHIKTITLPRKARDQHWGSCENEAFSLGPADVCICLLRKL